MSYVPQCVPNVPVLRRSVVVWAVAALFMLWLVGMIVGAPLAQAHGDNFLAATIYGAFNKLCHQIPERSFYVEGHPFAVCARCTGIYFGFAAGVLVYPLLRSLRVAETPARVWLFVAAAPTAIDFALGFFNIWRNTHLSRSLTGALFGAVCAFYVVPGLVDLSRTDWRRFFKRSSAVETEQATETIAQASPAPSDYSSPSSRI